MYPASLIRQAAPTHQCRVWAAQEWNLTTKVETFPKYFKITVDLKICGTWTQVTWKHPSLVSKQARGSWPKCLDRPATSSIFNFCKKKKDRNIKTNFSFCCGKQIYKKLHCHEADRGTISYDLNLSLGRHLKPCLTRQEMDERLNLHLYQILICIYERKKTTKKADQDVSCRKQAIENQRQQPWWPYMFDIGKNKCMLLKISDYSITSERGTMQFAVFD